MMCTKTYDPLLSNRIREARSNNYTCVWPPSVDSLSEKQGQTTIHVFATLLTCIQTCNITILIYGYARSLTNHIMWHKYQWFITMATYWLHFDVIEMHMRFISLLSISFVKNSTQITSDLCSQVNITKYCLIYWQFTPEEITAVIETCWHACDWFCCCCHSVLIGRSSSGFIYMCLAYFCWFYWEKCECFNSSLMEISYFRTWCTGEVRCGQWEVKASTTTCTTTPATWRIFQVRTKRLFIMYGMKRGR